MPPDSSSAILANAPFGQRLFRPRHLAQMPAVSSLPNRSGFDATTMVRVVIGFFCAFRLFMRISAWLSSQLCATNTASRPNTTAKAIITMVLTRTDFFRV